MPKSKTVTMKFTSDPKYYEIGDTITIKLSNGKIVVYKVDSIDKKKKNIHRHISSYLSTLVERLVLRANAPLLKGLDQIAKEMLEAYLTNAADDLIPSTHTATVRFVPKVKILKKRV